jgi:hypothetical protein
MLIKAILCLSVAYIYVWYIAGSNVALNRPANQQSTYNDEYASFAVDGDYLTVSCTTMDDANPWWSVDLGHPQQVKAVNVTNDENVNFRNCITLSYRKKNFMIQTCKVLTCSGHCFPVFLKLRLIVHKSTFDWQDAVNRQSEHDISVSCMETCNFVITRRRVSAVQHVIRAVMVAIKKRLKLTRDSTETPETNKIETLIILIRPATSSKVSKFIRGVTFPLMDEVVDWRIFSQFFSRTHARTAQTICSKTTLTPIDAIGPKMCTFWSLTNKAFAGSSIWQAPSLVAKNYFFLLSRLRKFLSKKACAINHDTLCIKIYNSAWHT